MSNVPLLPTDTAGTRITTKFISVLCGETIGAVRKMLINKAKEFEVIDYIYVVDYKRVLQGVISIKDLLQNSEEIRVDKIMKSDPITVDSLTDQERIIYLALEHNLKAVPVTGKNKQLLGVIPYDTIVKILHHEFREDILRSGGIHHKLKEIEDIETSTINLVRARVPSLILGLIGGLLAAYIVTGFEDVLSSYLVLASFIPVIIYLSDAVGTQSETLIVRMMALKPEFSIRKYLLREMRIGAILGATFALMLFIVATVGWGAINLGVAIGLSMFISIILLAFTATYIPLLLSRFGFDPGVASGPITTIVSDITSLTLYFIIAVILLNLF
jgi:magnesium transporter